MRDTERHGGSKIMIVKGQTIGIMIRIAGSQNVLADGMVQISTSSSGMSIFYLTEERYD